MITLRTLEFEVDKDPKSLLINLHVHTDRTEITSLNYPVYDLKLNSDPTWIGQIDPADKKFKLIRNKGQRDLFQSLSSIVIKGQITGNENKSMIKIDLQLTGPDFFNNIILTLLLIPAAVLLPNRMILEYWWAGIIWIVLLSSNFVRLSIDLNKTTKKLTEYFEAQTVPT